MENSRTLKEELLQGKYQELFQDIYQDRAGTEAQNSRYAQAIEKFEELFGEKQVEIYSAPGRSEVGGNHTDHQHGMVLATSINLDAIAVVSPGDSSVMQVVSEGYDMIEVDTKDLEAKYEEEGTTAALIRGVAASLAEKGYKVGGFQAYITSDVLIGAGLSSSAAFEVLLGTILSGLYNDMKIDPVEIAKAGQFAENVYFGKPCGLMDQMACSVGGLIYIDFQDPAHPVVEQVDMGTEDYSLCIVDTKGSHADLTEDYAMIPLEMKSVARVFGKEVLRDVDKEEFIRNIPFLREKLGDRCVLRAMHFFNENERVKEQTEALGRSDFAGFLELVKASGDSSFKYLQNIYTNHDVQHQSMSIALALSEEILGENGVCRVHGGGFAGTIQAFVQNSFVKEYKERIELVFGEGACHVLKIRTYGGIQVM